MTASTPSKLCLHSVALLLLCAAAPAAAQTVLIDWSTSATVANPAGDGKYWNSLGANTTGGDLTTTALVDLNNAAAGISVAVDNTANSSNNTGADFGGIGIAGPTGPDPFDEAGAVIDGIYANYNANGTSSITFTGLAPNTRYDFSLIGGRASNGSDGIIKVVQGIADANAVDNDLTETDDLLDAYTLLNSGSVLNFSATSTGGGVIELKFFEAQNDTNGGTSATLNALRLAPADGSPPVVDPPPAATERLRIGQWIRPASPASVIEQPGWHVWGGNVVEANGQYHMFYARWPVAGYAWGDGWLFASEIWHAVADAPAGPFTPTQLVLGSREDSPDDAFWDSRAPHNPHVRQFDGKFYLYYTATRDPGEAVWPGVSQRNRLQRSQRIGVVAANSVQDLLDGNFTRSADPLLEPVTGNSAADDISSNPDPSAIPANRITNNPSVIERPDGKYQMIYKTNWPQAPGFAFGQALADSPTGPFTYVPGALLNDGGQYEDQFHWYDPVLDQYNLIIKRFGTGLDQFVSADSNTWTLLGRQSDIAVFRSDGSFESLDLMERPQMLLGPDGRPQALYTAVRESLGGGDYLSYNMQIPLGNPTASATVMTGESDILTSGLPIMAVNLGTDSPLTLNGLEFSAAGLDPATLATEYGFTQAGGDAAASLNTALVDVIYDGIPEFEGFLDSVVWQTQATQANASLSFPLTGLTPGRTYRLQLFLGETRSTFPRHGPQLLEIGGATRIRFDFGPSSSLVASGATAIRLTATFTADAPDTTVSLRNATSGGGGLQLAAFALHDVSTPNIVLFLVDDMGVHDTSVPFLLNGSGQPTSYNFNNFYQTPNMETLASQGMRFTSAYAQTVCSPTRVGLLTGRTSARHGVTDWVGANDPGSPTNWRVNGITESEVTLPQLLQAAGYRTIHCGKGHFATSNVDINNLGFDVNIAGNEKGQPGRYIGSGGYGVPGLDAYDSTTVFLTKALTIEANAAIENAVNAGRPFFLNMSFYALHTPFATNPDATGDYSAAVNSDHRKYATMVEGMDIAVGEIRQKLIDLGVAENTLIVFVGDNGTDSPATSQDTLPSGIFSDWPMRGKKASKWEGGARVPFIATWALPDAGNPLQQALPIPANSIETDIVTTWDIPATLLDFVGLPIPADFGEDSHSLLPYFSGTPGSHRPQEIAVHYPHEHRSDFFSWLRQGDMKLIYNFQSNSHELYNLAADPTESTNLAASQPTTAMALTRRLAQMLDDEWGPAGVLLPTISSSAPAGNVVSIPNQADIDIDNDGIDDRDEDANLNGIIDAGETDPDNDNSDNDNISDGGEVRLGTDPLDPNSFFFLTGELQLNGSIRLAWPSQPGISFEIRSSTDLRDWSTLVESNVPAADPGTSTSYTIPASAAPQEFYRVGLK